MILLCLAVFSLSRFHNSTNDHLSSQIYVYCKIHNLLRIIDIAIARTKTE